MHAMFALILELKKTKLGIFFPMETNQMFTMCNDFVHVINVDNLKCDLVLNCLLI
jgi:hypothetical protein